MVYTIIEHTPQGKVIRDLTTNELKEKAKEGDRKAIKELIKLKGGWSALTPAQKEKAQQLSLGFDVEL